MEKAKEEEKGHDLVEEEAGRGDVGRASHGHFLEGKEELVHLFGVKAREEVVDELGAEHFFFFFFLQQSRNEVSNKKTNALCHGCEGNEKEKRYRLDGQGDERKRSLEVRVFFCL